MKYTDVSAEEFASLDGLDDWRQILGTIQANFRAGSFGSAAALVAAIAVAADGFDHHPDIDLRYRDHVRVVLTTHATGGLTTVDVETARAISKIAASAGATSHSSDAQFVEIAIDTMDPDRIRPFWEAVLGYRDINGSLSDPLRHGPPIWFQQMDAPRTDRDRVHLDVIVPHDVAIARVAAALAAGGTLVSEEFAKAWWILADADGNEACVCTWQDRATG